jgi:plastocyanin
LEAQRIGLKIIREAVGEEVVLDKDGSPMLNPVGLVDAGRISQDTGHTFEASRDAASGIAARYYMNRHYFIADPDAFTVSTQTVDDQSWHGGRRPLTLDEARVSITLAAVSGGMFEIGDDLPTLGASAERLALLENPDLIEMARLGRSSIPMDLMSYAAPDRQPSIFLLKESERQSILVIFNWTDAERTRAIDFAALGLKEPGRYRMVDVFGEPNGKANCCMGSGQSLEFSEKAHSVRVLKLIDESVPPVEPRVEIHAATRVKAGESVDFGVTPSSTATPVLTCHWDFGDGSGSDGKSVTHAFTHAGDYAVKVTAAGLGATTSRQTITVSVSGEVSTQFDQRQKLRPQ